MLGCTERVCSNRSCNRSSVALLLRRHGRITHLRWCTNRLLSVTLIRCLLPKRLLWSLLHAVALPILLLRRILGSCRRLVHSARSCRIALLCGRGGIRRILLHRRSLRHRRT